MGRCSGACAGRISRDDYLEIVDSVRKLLSGKTGELVAELRLRMAGAASRQEYEKAALTRDQIAAIEELATEQKVMELSEGDRDYVALAPAGEGYAAVVLQVREGKLLGKEVFHVREYASEQEAISHFIARYYGETTQLPQVVYAEAAADAEGLTRLLREAFGRALAVRVPQRGKHAQFIAMAAENAREEAVKSSQGGAAALALESLAGAMGLPRPPLRIEGFDIAHLDGTDTVASLVSFRNGKPERRQYRSFTIRSLGGKIDDFEAIREAVARRYARQVNEGHELPDLILIDGGKGQLNAAKASLTAWACKGCLLRGLPRRKKRSSFRAGRTPFCCPRRHPV